MDDFSTPGTPNAFGLWPSPYNYPEPLKRPLSSTCPTIMENESGDFHLAIGGSGGSKIFPAVFQTILNMDWGQDISTAIEYGRFHDQLYPEYMEIDDVYPSEIVADLEGRGHTVQSMCNSSEWVTHSGVTLTFRHSSGHKPSCCCRKCCDRTGRRNIWYELVTSEFARLSALFTSYALAASDSRKNGIAAGY